MYGEDSFSLHEELRKIKAGYGNPEMLAVNTTSLNGDELNPSQLQDVCSASPFLHEVRLVIVEGLLGRFEPSVKSQESTSKSKLKSDSKVKEWQALYNYIEIMPSSTVLILIDGQLSIPKNILFKHLSSLAEIKNFPQLKSQYLRDWIRERVIKGGSKINNGAVNLLEKLVGNNLWNINSEVEKLLAFCNGRLITENDVEQVASYSRETSIFALTDALLEGRRRESQQLLHRLFQDGVSPLHILTMISRQLRLITIAKEIKPDMKMEQIMLKLGINQEWKLNIVLRQASLHHFEEIKRTYERLLTTDIAIKTGEYDADLAIDLLLLDICKN